MIEAAIAVAELMGEPTPEGECSVHLDGVQEVVAGKGYHSNEACLVWTSWNCEATLPSPIAALRTGSARRRRRLRYTATGGGFRAIAARVCSGTGESGSRGTSHIGLIPADWAGWSSSIPIERLVGLFGLTVRNGPG